MNLMTSFDDAPTTQNYADGAMPSADVNPSGQTFTLRQTGGRPVTFAGVQLAMAMNFAPGVPLWYEINVFHLIDGRFVADVRCFKTSEKEEDTFSVFEASSFEDVVHRLEQYEPSNDILIGFDLEDPMLSVADLAFHATSLRVRVENARRQYRTLLSQVLYDLHQPDL